jgi:hypothetical protein
MAEYVLAERVPMDEQDRHAAVAGLLDREASV